MSKNDSYELSCKRLGETNNAVRVYDYASEEEIWFPLSQVEEMHFDANGDGTLVVTGWIARQKGLD